MGSMNAKDALHAHVDALTEEEAAELLAQIEWDTTEEEELTPEEARAADAGFDEIHRGDFVDGGQLLRRVGLSN